MRILITGATGLIGRRLVVDRLERGDDVVLVSRDKSRASRLFAAHANPRITVVEGHPGAPGKWQEAVNVCDAVVHLAGAGIADRRWTKKYKRVLEQSRIDSAHQVVMAIEDAVKRPGVLISSSAVGYYGDKGDQVIDEGEPAGEDFLAQLAVRWEEQAYLAQEFGARVVCLRTGVVLDDRGGAIAQLRPLFRWCFGGPLGSGRQFMSWIHWRDLIGLIDFALINSSMKGALNACSPNPLTNREFSRALADAMNRPSWLPAPRFMVRLALGEVADALFASLRVRPQKALDAGYAFLYPDIEKAMDSVVGTQEETEEEWQRATAFTAASAMPSAPIRLLAIGVDGTLLRSDGSISQSVVHACRAAQRAGCVVILATSRPPRGMRMIVQTLNLNSPTINYNGAVIWNPATGTAQYHEPLPAEVARGVVEAVQAADSQLFISLEILNRWYANRLDEKFISSDGAMGQPDGVGSLDTYLNDPVTKINILGKPESVKAAREIIRIHFWQPGAVAVFQPGPRAIQVAHPKVDKGIALQRIAKRMNLTRDEVMAIGDAANDQGMVEWAGFGVAVANAAAGVRKLAQAVVPSNDDVGVARAIQRFILSGR